MLTNSGRIAPDLYAQVITSQQADIVFLQGLGAPVGVTSVKHLANLVNMVNYGPVDEGSCSFLSRFPLTNLQSAPLGYGARCLRADLDYEGGRIHLFNILLGWDVWQRYEQVKVFLSDQVLNNRSLPCGTVIAGDFGLPFWKYGEFDRAQLLKRAGKPFFHANYPAQFPLWGRDRIYLRGPLKILSTKVIRTSESKAASAHLPLLADVKSEETRTFLKVKNSSPIAAKQPNPICG
jgi:endonuclease/exonuclease/phosphatase family metal-dependent hydrolase